MSSRGFLLQAMPTARLARGLPTAELTFYCFPQEKAKEEFHFLPYEVEE